MDYTNKSLGLRVQTQIPLNVKEYKESEASLKDLGFENNLAFTYEKGLVVYCILEGTRYEWREVQDSDVGLLDTHFIYPNNIITFGIDYSNKKYNFIQVTIDFPIPVGLQDVISVDDTLTENNVIHVNTSLDILSENEDLLNGLQIKDINLTNSTTPFVKLGKNLENLLNDVSLNFLPNSAIFNDDQNNKGLEYADDYESNFTSRSLITQQYLLSQIIENRTKINAGSNITVTGNGTTSTPFIISSTSPTPESVQKTLTYPADFTSSTYTLQNIDMNKLIFIKNGNFPVTIIVPASLPNEFFAAFIRADGGEVTFQGSGSTIFSAVGLRINSTYDQVALDKEGSFNQFYLTGNTKI